MHTENFESNIYKQLDENIKIFENYNNLINNIDEKENEKLDLKELYNIKENILVNDKKEDNFKILKPSLLRDSGIVLSYGVGDDFIPAGAYSISRFVDKNKQPIKEEINDIADVFIEFTEVDYIKGIGTQNKIYGSKIYIPYLEFIKLYKKYSNDNTNELEVILGEDQNDIDLLAYFEKLTEEYMSANLGIDSYDSTNFKGESMEDINCEFSSREVLRGNNFKVIPFSFGIVKKLIKTKDAEDIEEKEYEIEEEKVRTR